MIDLIAISTLNDFIFCPYSIYLHQVYMDADEDMYHAKPQTRGRNAHEKVDMKNTSTNHSIIESLPVSSHELGLYGKIDVYHQDSKTLTERKYQLKQIFQGQYYQLWAQYFCMLEMGYDVQTIAFYEISTRKTIKVPLPCEAQKDELVRFIDAYRAYDPKAPLIINQNKCSHCIYCNLCDKTDTENVYS